MRKIAQITKNICTLSILLKCVNKCTKHLLDMHLQCSFRPISAFDSLKSILVVNNCQPLKIMKIKNDWKQLCLLSEFLCEKHFKI